MLSIEKKPVQKMSRLGIAIMVVLTLWVLLDISSFFLHFLHKSGSGHAIIFASSLIWVVIFLCMTTFISRDGLNGWSIIYNGRFGYTQSNGVRGILKYIFVLISFSILIGFISADIFAAPTIFLAKKIGSSDFRVTDISYFRGSITRKYIVEVSSDDFSGQFLWRDSDPALAKVRINNNISSHDIDCLHINYRYWYFGAVVESLQNCELRHADK